STDPSCEGQRTEVILGYLSSVATPATPVGVARCDSGRYRFHVLGASPSGGDPCPALDASARFDKFLGYVNTSLPRGVYATIPASATIPSAVKNNGGIIGVNLGIYWNAVEKTQGHPDWTAVDARIAEAKAAG